jgi:predicted kinase
MKGLPASGKSTKAEEILRDSGNAIRLNKDLMRKMLHFDKWTGRNENLTRNAMRTLAREFLLEGKTVIIDDTNLNPGTMQSWKDLATSTLGTRVEIIDMTDVQVELCVMRDNERAEPVGGTVIKNMALRYGLKTFSQGSVILCDIDGTISDTTHRLHHVKVAEGEKKDWKSFFAEMDKDPVRDDVRKILIQHYNQGKNIIFMSARPDTYRDVTLKWLHDNNLSFAYTVIMRNSQDKRPDTETKRDMLNQHFPDRGVIDTIIDDRPSVIRLWKEMGLNVIDVGKGEEF